MRKKRGAEKDDELTANEKVGFSPAALIFPYHPSPYVIHPVYINNHKHAPGFMDPFPSYTSYIIIRSSSALLAWLSGNVVPSNAAANSSLSMFSDETLEESGRLQ